MNANKNLETQILAAAAARNIQVQRRIGCDSGKPMAGTWDWLTPTGSWHLVAFGQGDAQALEWLQNGRLEYQFKVKNGRYMEFVDVSFDGALTEEKKIALLAEALAKYPGSRLATDEEYAQYEAENEEWWQQEGKRMSWEEENLGSLERKYREAKRSGQI